MLHSIAVLCSLSRSFQTHIQPLANKKPRMSRQHPHKKIPNVCLAKSSAGQSNSAGVVDEPQPYNNSNHNSIAAV